MMSTPASSSLGSKAFRVCVAGSGGFIGSHLARYLKFVCGYFVIAADIRRNEYMAEDEFCDEFMQLDLRNVSNCLICTRNCHWVFNLAADMGGMGFIASNQATIIHNNTLITLNVLEASRINGVKRVFYASSACVYPEHIQSSTSGDDIKLSEDKVWPAQPQDAYGLEKLYGEQIHLNYQRDFNLDVRIARFHNIYGPAGTWKNGREKVPAAIARKIATLALCRTQHINVDNHVEIWGDGQQTRSFCYIDDCVEGVVRLMRSEFNQPINIGSDVLMSVNDLVDLVAQFDSLDVGKRYLAGPQGVRGRNSDNALIKHVLQWAPSTSPRKGMQQTYRWIKQQIANELNDHVDITRYLCSNVVQQTPQSLNELHQTELSTPKHDAQDERKSASPPLTAAHSSQLFIPTKRL